MPVKIKLTDATILAKSFLLLITSKLAAIVDEMHRK